MKYRNREYPLPKINRADRLSAEDGQISWILGLYLILFLILLLCMQIQLAVYRASAMYMEDALALSNLASAVIDVQEYGSMHKVRITDPWQAYDRYCAAMKENLGLDDSFEAGNHGMISGKVELLNYTIYNVTGSDVSIWEYDGGGQVREWQGKLGEVRTPMGQIVEATGVYSEISYPVEGFLGITVTARKGKLVDVIGGHSEEEINGEETEENESESEK